MAVIGSLGEFGLSELFLMIGNRTGLLRFYNGSETPLLEAELANGLLCGVHKENAPVEDLTAIFAQLKTVAHADPTFEFIEDRNWAIRGQLKLPLSQISDNLRLTGTGSVPTIAPPAPVAAPAPQPVTAPAPVAPPVAQPAPDPVQVNTEGPSFTFSQPQPTPPAPVVQESVPAPAIPAPVAPPPIPEQLPYMEPVAAAPTPAPIQEPVATPPAPAPIPEPVAQPPVAPPSLPPALEPMAAPTPTTISPPLAPTAVTGFRKKTTRLLPQYNPEWAEHIFVLANEPKTWLEQDLQKFYDEARPKLIRSVSLKDLSLHLLVEEVVVYVKLQKLVTLGIVKEASKVEEVAGLTRPLPKLMRHTQRVQLPPSNS